MVGTHYNRLPLGFISTKPSKKTAICWSKWWKPLTIVQVVTITESIDYAWKDALTNAPHDSICGCSDEVHREMEFVCQGQVSQALSR